VESNINKGLAYQLRAMREARNWSQEELAALVDMPQTAISRLESPNYGRPTITTLKRMARVYDVGLDVRFVPFSLLVDRMSKTPRVDMGLTSDSVDVPSFEDEEHDNVFKTPSTTIVPEALPARTANALEPYYQNLLTRNLRGTYFQCVFDQGRTNYWRREATSAWRTAFLRREATEQENQFVLFGEAPRATVQGVSQIEPLSLGGVIPSQPTQLPVDRRLYA